MPPLIAATSAEVRKQAGSRAFLLALVVILPCAAFLVGLDAAYIYGRIDGEVLPWQLNLSEEGAIAEWFEYALTGAATWWMARLWLRKRAPAFLGAASTFAWLTLDNGLGLHEAMGATLAPLLAGFAGERSADLGELIVFSLVALALATILAVAIRASASTARAPVLCVLAPVAIGAGFGVAMDFVSHLVDGSRALGLLLDFVEDGGELTMLCLAAAFAASVRFNSPRSAAPEGSLQPSLA